MKKGIIFAVLCAFLLLAAGCSKKEADVKDYQDNTVILRTDGTIDEISVEKFDEGTTENEVKAFIDGKVSEFNKNHPAIEVDGKKVSAVSVTEFGRDGNNMRLIMKYANCEMYALMNDVTLETMHASDAMDIKATFIMVEREGGKKITLDEIASDDKLYAMHIEPYDSLRVVIDGEIEYMSDNVIAEDDNEVIVYGPSLVIFK